MAMRMRLGTLVVGLTVVLVGSWSRPSSGSVVILPGYDLLTTVTPGTTFAGFQFQGVPLGTFNFGGMIGVQNVYNTDTIVRRLNTANGSLGGSAMVPIEMVALQLVSVMPINLGAGLDFHFITLQSARGGQATTGQMTIHFDPVEPPPPGPPQPLHGTFDSFFDVFFDIRIGSLNGPIISSQNLQLNSSGTPWSHYPPATGVQINGANANLNGMDRLNDFWTAGTVTETHPSGAMHVVTNSSVPEPSTLVSAALLALLGTGYWRRRRLATLSRS